MADISVDVNLPEPISVDVSSPTQSVNASIFVAGPEGPRGPAGEGYKINNLTGNFLYLTGRDGISISDNGSDTIYISGNSGYFQLQINTLTSNLYLTGSNLNSSISYVSGVLQNTINDLNNNYATDLELINTGEHLNIKINTLSGYLINNFATINNLFSTGSNLQSQINNLGNTYVTKTNGQFNDRPTLNGTGFLLSGEAGLLPNTIVYTTGHQDISGVKTFIDGITIGDDITPLFLEISGNSLNVYGSGNFLDGLFVKSIPVVTGYELLSSYATKINLSATGSTLDTKINSLSGNLTSTYATITNLASTGSTLDNKIGSLSGYSASAANLISTGSALHININSLSGLFTGYTGNLDATFASDSQLFNTGSTLQTNINNLSGVSVLTFGNQNISGDKVFINNLYISGTGFFQNINLSNLEQLVISGAKVTINGNSGVYINTSLYLSGNPVLTGVDLSSYATVGNLVVTGNTLDNKINVLSGNSVLTYGNQNILGNKIFDNTGAFNTLSVTNKKLTSYSYLTSNFIFGDNYINLINSVNRITGVLPSTIISGINYYVKNLNTGILTIIPSGNRNIDGFSDLNLYKNESLQLIGVNNVGYTGWVTISTNIGIS
jgi:hypothetical protein